MTAPREPIQLDACPFCAGPPKAVATRWVGGGAFTAEELDGPEGLAVSAHVFCHECGAQGEEVESIAFDRPEVDVLIANACALWNRRDQRNAELFAANKEDDLCCWPTKYEVTP